MRIKVNFLENIIELEENKICSLQVENKKYFYRIVYELYKIANGRISDELDIEDLENNKMCINIILNYFDFESCIRKYQNEIIKYISLNASETERDNINKKYNIFSNEVLKLINEYNLPLNINDELTFQNILKNVKLSINNKENILENLFTIIDLESKLKINKMLIFVSLKQYLTEEELTELYKYCIYNKVMIFMIDNQLYKSKNEYEKIIAVDDNLNEFML